MVRRSIAGLLAAGVLAVSVALVSAAPDPNFSLAVLRRDGVMIPFAAYGGRGWSVPWPGSETSIIPISLADVPKNWWGEVGPAAPWTAWLDDDVKKPVTPIKPVHVPIFCGAHLAIQTDYRGAAAPEAERAPTVPKDGLATAGEVTLLPITQVSVHAPDATRLVAAITATFNEVETTAANNFTRFDHPYGATSRAAREIELETVYRVSDTIGRTPFRTSYIEAVRRYPALAADNGCGLLTFVSGWVTEFADERKPIINLGARVTYCDRAEVSFMQPFGRIQIDSPRGGRGRTPGPETFWVYQMSSWRDEFYRIARVAADGVEPVVVVAGGGCPKEPER
jgi:hypothetical protein